MKTFYNRINSNKYFLLFILFFAYAQSIYSRIGERSSLDIYIFTPDGALGTMISVGVLFFVIDFFLKRYQKLTISDQRETFKIFTVSILTYLILIQFIGFIIALIFNNVSRNFNQETLMLTTFSYLLNGFIYGSFFLAYNFYKKNKKDQAILIQFNTALAESRINQLKAQLNPHFLFNNLNVLDQLIEEDKNKASDFLNEFADIYRFVLQVSDKKIIPLSEELTFAKQYLNLIKHKYGKAYQLLLEGQNTNGFIVPLTLQLLIENAVQHNLGSETNPVIININIDQHIRVSNNLIVKRNKKPTSGRALNNLKEQYLLLSAIPIDIQINPEKFAVTIPIIYPLEN